MGTGCRFGSLQDMLSGKPWSDLPHRLTKPMGRELDNQAGTERLDATTPSANG